MFIMHHNAKPLQRYHDYVIFKMTDIFCRILECLNFISCLGRNHQGALWCQISWKMVQCFSRYRNFFSLEDGGHSWYCILKYCSFIGWLSLEGHNASPCQIVSKLGIPCQIYLNVLIFSAWRYAKRGICRHRVSLCVCVCLFVCLSHSGIVSKWLNVGSRK